MTTTLILRSAIDFVNAWPVTVDPSELEGEETTLESVKLMFAKSITSMSMDDSNMTLFLEDRELISQLIGWLSLEVPITSSVEFADDIHMSGALALGNLCRSDASCELLVNKYAVMPPLLKLISSETERLALSVTHKGVKIVLKVVHAVAGAIKNISLCGRSIIDEREHPFNSR